MNDQIIQLVPAVVAYVANQGGYVTKTKLLKLLYLIDVDFYRVHHRTLTGFQWKYFHLGPWTNEFDPVLEKLLRENLLHESRSERSEYETRFFHSTDSPDFGRFFNAYSDQAIVTVVLDTWGNRSTAEILDYVYFQTEPMEHGVRNERLDFSKISNDISERYRRSASGKTKKEIAKLRADFRKKSSALPDRQFRFTPPRYDDDFLKALEKLDSGNL